MLKRKFGDRSEWKRVIDRDYVQSFLKRACEWSLVMDKQWFNKWRVILGFSDWVGRGIRPTLVVKNIYFECAIACFGSVKPALYLFKYS